MIRSAVFIQYTRVSDGRTDRIGVAYKRYSIGPIYYAVARKNAATLSLLAVNLKLSFSILALENATIGLSQIIAKCSRYCRLYMHPNIIIRLELCEAMCSFNVFLACC